VCRGRTGAGRLHASAVTCAVASGCLGNTWCVCVCVCVCVCMYVCVCVMRAERGGTYVHTYVCTCVHTHTHVYAHMYKHLTTSAYICTYRHIDNNPISSSVLCCRFALRACTCQASKPLATPRPRASTPASSRRVREARLSPALIVHWLITCAVLAILVPGMRLHYWLIRS